MFTYINVLFYFFFFLTTLGLLCFSNSVVRNTIKYHTQIKNTDFFVYVQCNIIIISYITAYVYFKCKHGRYTYRFIYIFFHYFGCAYRHCNPSVASVEKISKLRGVVAAGHRDKAAHKRPATTN